MNRRRFLSALIRGLGLLTLGFWLFGCGKGGDELDGTTSLNNGQGTASNPGQTIQSTPSGGHSHQIFVSCTNLRAGQPFSVQTSVSAGHMHFLVLSSQQLNALRQGQTIRVFTQGQTQTTGQFNTTGNHSHQFQIIAC